MNDKITNELNKKLKVVVALLLRMVPRESKSITLRDQIALLDNIKIRPKEMAEIIGRTQSYVNKELVSIRKESKKQIIK